MAGERCVLWGLSYLHNDTEIFFALRKYFKLQVEAGWKELAERMARLLLMYKICAFPLII